MRALSREPTRPALIDEHGTVTLGELRDLVSRLGQALAARGVGSGTAVAVLSRNRREVPALTAALAIGGARTTALSAVASFADHCFILADAEIDTLVLDAAAFEDRAADYVARVPSLRQVLTLGPSAVGSDLVAEAVALPPATLVAAPRDADDLTSIAYTGGTTGTPKGVVGSCRTGAALTQIQLAEWDWPHRPRLLLCTPLSHAGGAFALPALLRDGTVVALPSFDAGRVLATIARLRISAIFLVPTMLYKLLDHPDLDRTDLSSLQTVFYGAAPMDPDRLADGIRRIGPVFFQFYGQTECGMTIAVLHRDDHDLAQPARLASCGRPVPWLDVRLLDGDLVEVPMGDVGEICVRGPLVTRGYWRRPELTAETLRGGWLHTGDLGRFDGDGYLSIVGRSKDLIVSGGFNVYPAEVEAVLRTDPTVADVAVVGLPDDTWGEAVTAFVVAAAGAPVDAARLQALVRGAKGAVQTPKSVRVVPSLPLTSLGKVDKDALRSGGRR